MKTLLLARTIIYTQQVAIKTDHGLEIEKRCTSTVPAGALFLCCAAFSLVEFGFRSLALRECCSSRRSELKIAPRNTNKNLMRAICWYGMESAISNLCILGSVLAAYLPHPGLRTGEILRELF